MEAAINRTAFTCPQYLNASDLVRVIYDPKKFTDPDKLAEIACEARRLLVLSPYLTNTYMYKIFASGCAIGTLGAILALLTYSLKEFQANAFCYYRAINAFELGYMFFYLVTSTDLIPASVTRDLVVYVTKSAAKCTKYIILWTAFDRAVALRWPIVYPKLDSKKVVNCVLFVCLCLGSAYVTGMTYYEMRLKYFRIPSPDLTLAVVTRVARAIEGGMMFVLMPVVLVGLVRMSRRKKKLLENQRSNQTLVDQIRINSSLCILQLCEGVPFVLLCLLTYFSYVANFLTNDRSKSYPYVSNETYEANAFQQTVFAIQIYTQSIFVNVVDAYCHGCHFYMYVAFSPKFRKAVLGFIRKRIANFNSSVTPVS